MGAAASILSTDAGRAEWYAAVRLAQPGDAIQLLERERADCVAALRSLEKAADFALTRDVCGMAPSREVVQLADVLLDVSFERTIAAIFAADNAALLKQLRVNVVPVALRSMDRGQLLRDAIGANAVQCALFIAPRCSAARDVTHEVLCSLLFTASLVPVFRALPIGAVYALDRPDFNSVLHAAAARGDDEAVRVCLDRGMSPSATNVLGETALFHAVRGLHAAVAQTLLRFDDNGVLVRNIRGQTALDCLDAADERAAAFRAAFVAELCAWRVEAQRAAVLAFFGVEPAAATAAPIEFQICSDLHLEFEKSPPSFATLLDRAPPSCRFLALLGDIGVAVNPSYRTFVQSCADDGGFERVFVVAGNHEFYRGELRLVLQEMADIVQTRDSVTLLHRSSTVVTSGERRVRVIGSTLWTHVEPAATQVVSIRLNDYQMISNTLGLKGAQLTLDNLATIDAEPLAAATVADFAAFANHSDLSDAVLEHMRKGEFKLLRVCDTNAIHKADVAFFDEQCRLARAAGEDCVIFTHHAPLAPSQTGVGCPDEWHVEHESGNGTDLRALIAAHPNLVAMCYGHTHWFSDLTILSPNGGKCRVVSNPRGYASDPLKFNRSFVVSV